MINSKKINFFYRRKQKYLYGLAFFLLVIFIGLHHSDSYSTLVLTDNKKLITSEEDSVSNLKELEYLSNIKKVDKKDYLELSKSALNEAKSGNYEKAILEYNKLIEINPSNAKAFYNRGYSYMQLGNYISATKDFNKAVEINSNFPEAFFNRGWIQGELGNYEKAILDYSKGLKLNSKDDLAFFNRGWNKGELGRYKEAILDYNKAIKINPKNGMYYHHLGVTKILSGMSKEGCFDLERSAQLGHQYAIEKYESYCTRYA